MTSSPERSSDAPLSSRASSPWPHSIWTRRDLVDQCADPFAKYSSVILFGIDAARGRIRRQPLKSLHGGHERVNRLLLEQYSRVTVDDSFRRTTSPKGNARPSRCLSFGGRDAEILVSGKNESPGARKQLSGLRVTEPTDKLNG